MLADGPHSQEAAAAPWPGEHQASETLGLHRSLSGENALQLGPT